MLLAVAIFLLFYYFCYHFIFILFYFSFILNAIRPKASEYPYDVEKDSDSRGIVRFERDNRLDQVEFMKKKERKNMCFSSSDTTPKRIIHFRLYAMQRNLFGYAS